LRASQTLPAFRRVPFRPPESYPEMLFGSDYHLGEGAVMMLPGTCPELVSIGFQMSAATPVR
ncbi:hypothetical protein E4V51_19490, partial [Paenibacillus sp. 28ISP30-2]|nr:hypothetical protein [Paenibacillus sp. 28ISP30-2]